MARDSVQLEIEGTQRTTCSLRMHSQYRRYSVENGLTCERTSFIKNFGSLIQDYLGPNLTELAKFVKYELFRFRDDIHSSKDVHLH